MRVNGELKDKATDGHDDRHRRSRSTIDSPDGLSILRHSTAHVMAQAVQTINPDAKLGIGPPITDGFYYDFDVAEPFTPEDLKAIEKEMDRIIRSGSALPAPGRHRGRSARRARRRALQARADRAQEPGSRRGQRRRRRVGRGRRRRTDDLRQRVDRTARRSGRTYAAARMCRTPARSASSSSCGSPPPTGGARRRTRSCSASTAPRGRRKDELRAYTERLEEAAKRDHRKLGAELDLFSFPEEIGSGLSVWHPARRPHPHGDGAARPPPAHRGRLHLRLHAAHRQAGPLPEVQPPGHLQGGHVPADRDGRGASTPTATSPSRASTTTSSP